MYGSAACTLQKVINAGYYQQLVTMFLKMQKALVGIYHLLQIYLLLNHMHE